MGKTFGEPGESARQQAETRRLKREEAERLAAEEKHWTSGKVGEEKTGIVIEKHCPNAVTLHDRCAPGSKANIDHIVLVPSGVWVIDSKRVNGRIELTNGDRGTQK